MFHEITRQFNSFGRCFMLPGTRAIWKLCRIQVIQPFQPNRPKQIPEQTVDPYVRRLTTNRLIRIYTVCLSDFDICQIPFFFSGRGQAQGWKASLQKFRCKSITKTCLYNVDPLKPHFYILKLGFTGVHIFVLISAQKHRLWILVRTTSPRRF